MEESKGIQQVRLFYFDNGRLKIARDIAILKEVPLNNFVWIDLNHVAPDTESQLEQFLKIYIQEEEEMEEIEMSSEAPILKMVLMNVWVCTFSRQ